MNEAVLMRQDDMAQLQQVHLSYDVYDELKKRLSKLDCITDSDWLEAREWVSAQIKQALAENILSEPDLPLTPEPIIDCSGSAEFLSLMAIRTDLKVKSSIALLDTVLDKLDQNTIRQLTQHNFFSVAS